MKKPTIPYSDFSKLDFRIGEIKDVTPVEGSKNLFKFTVDLGEEYGTVEILSGVAKWYKPEDFIGKKYVFLANLEPKPMMGLLSNGMALAIDNPEKPIFLQVDNVIDNGLVIT